MELDRGGQERVCDEVVKFDAGVGNLLRVFADVGVEVAQVPVDDLREHASNHILGRYLHRERRKVPLHPWGDVERPCRWVHARHVLHVEHFFQHDFLFIVPTLVVDVLPGEFDGRLGVVLVHVRHVEVIEEVHHSLRARWAETNAALLLEGLFHDHLERGRVHEVVHVNRAEAPVFGIEPPERFPHQRRLTGTRVADEHAVVLVLDERREEVGQARGLHARDEDVGEGFRRVVPEPLNLLLPRPHLHRRRVHVVVKHQPFLGVEHVLPLADPPLAELRAEIDSLVD